ncbi:MAG: hypothetical protein R3C99_00760 [Pirellulaceae bacterium]
MTIDGSRWDSYAVDSVTIDGVTIDDSDSRFSGPASWLQASFATLDSGDSTETATWTFDNLTPGQQYGLRASWPVLDSSYYDVRYLVKEGEQIIELRGLINAVPRPAA